LILSTNPPSTLIPSTNPPSQISSTLITSSLCLYPSVSNCGMNGIIVDLSLFNVSCILFQNRWIYLYKNKTSNLIEISSDLNLTNSVSVFIEGDFNQTSTSTITINLSNYSNFDSPLIVVSQCVELNGDIDINLNEKPSNNENISIVLISYNCSSDPKINEQNIAINTNYKDSNCDQIIKTSKVTSNSFTISVKAVLNKNCKGIFKF
jgi:hypothetical protein